HRTSLAGTVTGTTSNAGPARRVGMRIAGRYRLDRLLASGGMAQVWAATDETLRRRGAVKILHGHLRDDANLARFRDEGRILAKLRHPGIVAVFDTCERDDFDAIVMEYVDGPTLRAVLDAGPVEPRRAVDIAVALAEAL